jgi:MHS family proline/betaine transporter-like MFS transporter
MIEHPCPFYIWPHSLLAEALSSLVPENDISWFWRIPFIAAIVPALVGLYIRLRVEESPVFELIEQRDAVLRSPLRTALRNDWKYILIIFLLYSGLLIGYVAFAGLNLSLVTTYTDLPVNDASAGLSLSLIVVILLSPVFGLLADRVGSVPTMVAGCVLMVVVSYPAYALCFQGSFASFLLGQALLLASFSVLLGPSAAALVQMVPANVRVTSIAIGSNVAVAVWASLLPLVMLSVVEAFEPAPLGATLVVVVLVGTALATILVCRRQLAVSSERLADAEATTSNVPLDARSEGRP